MNKTKNWVIVYDIKSISDSLKTTSQESTTKFCALKTPH